MTKNPIHNHWKGFPLRAAKIFHLSLGLKELSAVPLSCPIFHHLCSAHLFWASALLPFSRSESSLNSPSALAVGRGKTHPHFYLFPFPTSSAFLSAQQTASVELPCVSGEELLWVACPVPWVGGRDNRSTSAPSGCLMLTINTSCTGHVSKNVSWHLGKSRAAGVGCSWEGKSWHPVWKISSLLVR